MMAFQAHSPRKVCNSNKISQIHHVPAQSIIKEHVAYQIRVFTSFFLVPGVTPLPQNALRT
jgi:hypothetical protein